MLIFSALSLQDEVIDFTLEDCPVYIRDNRIVLAKHEGSSILRADTIVRRDTETGIAEGDCIFYRDMLEGIVVYNQGFRMQTPKGRLKDLQLDGCLKIEKGKKFNLCEAVHSDNRQPIVLSYKDRTFSIKALLQYEEPFVVIHSQADYFRKVMADEIKIATGVKRYCYGDLCNGGRIVLHEAVPCVSKGSAFIKLSEIVGGKRK